MINPKFFFNILKKNNIDFFTGVPDSLLKDFCAYITDNTNDYEHIIAANEGASIALAVGNYLASGNIPLVYMQNSGLGNAINPLLSIADVKVYSIPILIMIGWRGEPGLKDEPQHIKQGEVNEEMLRSMQIPYLIIDGTTNIDHALTQAILKTKGELTPFVLLIRNNTFEKYKLNKTSKTTFVFNREEAIKLILNNLNDSDIVVSTTGKASREVFEHRKSIQQGHSSDFLTVGAMGHTSSIAAGISIRKPDKSIYCIDGDGSVIMHMGSLAIIGQMKGLENFKHIVINNGSHDSVGGQPTVAFEIKLSEIANSCGYTFTRVVETKSEIENGIIDLKNHKGRGFLEIKVNKGGRDDLGRPSTSPKENKVAFESFIQNS